MTWLGPEPQNRRGTGPEPLDLWATVAHEMGYTRDRNQIAKTITKSAKLDQRSFQIKSGNFDLKIPELILNPSFLPYRVNVVLYAGSTKGEICDVFRSSFVLVLSYVAANATRPRNALRASDLRSWGWGPDQTVALRAVRSSNQNPRRRPFGPSVPDGPDLTPKGFWSWATVWSGSVLVPGPVGSIKLVMNLWTHTIHGERIVQLNIVIFNK